MKIWPSYWLDRSHLPNIREKNLGTNFWTLHLIWPLKFSFLSIQIFDAKHTSHHQSELWFDFDSHMFLFCRKKAWLGWLVDSTDKGPVTRKMFPFDDVIMNLNIDWQETKKVASIWPTGNVTYCLLITLAYTLCRWPLMSQIQHHQIDDISIVLKSSSRPSRPENLGYSLFNICTLH